MDYGRCLIDLSKVKKKNKNKKKDKTIPDFGENKQKIHEIEKVRQSMDCVWK